MTKRLDLTPEAKKIIKEAESLAANNSENLNILHLLDACISSFVDKDSSFLNENGFDIPTNNLLECYRNNSFDKQIKDEIDSVRLEKILDNAEKFAESVEDYFINNTHILYSCCQQSVIVKILNNIGLDLENLIHFLERLITDSNDLSKEDKNLIDDGKFFDINNSFFSPDKQILSKYSTCLNYEFVMNGFTPVIGRDEEINQLQEILSKKIKSNAIFVGESGVGKTAIVEGFVQNILLDKVPAHMCFYQVFSIDLNSMISGTHFRGQFEERFSQLIKEAESDPNVILFFDEIHNITHAGDGSVDSFDASEILKPALARGKIKCIGTTTNSEYKKFFDRNGALKRRFEKIEVKEPSKEETKEILLGVIPHYEDHHGVSFSHADIDSILDKCSTFMSNKSFPDKAFDIIDQVGAKTKIEFNPLSPEIKQHKDAFNKLLQTELSTSELTNSINNYVKEISKISLEKRALVKVLPKTINKVFSEKTGIPEKVIGANKSSFSLFKDLMKSEIFGQDEIIDSIHDALSCAKVGLSDPNKPLCNFLFVGPTSVGKTYTAKKMAKYFYGSDKSFIQINMSEYQDKSSLGKLLGASAGYVGHEQGGLLTEFVLNNPNSIVLFDEIEKADRKVLDILLHLLDEGKVVDGLNREVSFSQCIIILTSNIGHRETSLPNTSIGFNSEKKQEKNIYQESLEKSLRPELLARIENIHVFNNLDDKTLNQIISKEINIISSRLTKSNKITLTCDTGIQNYIFDKIKQEKLHARSIKSLIRKELQTPIARFLIENNRRKKISVKVLDKNVKVS